MSGVKPFFTFFLAFLLFSGYAQVAVGEWRDHLSYRYGTSVEYSGDRIYTLTKGSLFYVDLNSFSVDKLTKVSGMSDIGASTIRYSPATGILIVGYSNGNIDLIENGLLYNIPDIKHKQMAADKTINKIFTEGNKAYVCTGFGIVVVDLAKKEIRDTYIIGPLGTYLCVYDMDTDGTYYYASTEKGIYKADKNDPGLVDFTNWSIITDIPNYQKRFKSVKCFNNRIYTFLDQAAWDGDTVYVYDNLEWKKYNEYFIRNVVQIEKTNSTLFIVEPFTLYALKQWGNEYYYSGWIDGLATPTDATTDAQDRMWVSDTRFGLVYGSGASAWSSTSPNGPDNSSTFAVTSEGDKVVAVAGGRNNSWYNLWNKGNFFVFENEIWSNYNPSNVPALDSIPDICAVAINPKNPSQYFLGSFNGGVVEMNDWQFVAHYHQNNSTLQAIPGPGYLRIGGLTFDEDENLWVTVCGVDNSLCVRKKDGTWKGFNLKNYIDEGEIAQIIVTQNNHKWLVLPRGKGLFAFYDNGTIDNTNDDQWLKFSVLDENGELISNDIYSIKEDQDGRIWLGTNKGVVVYYNPENVFTGESFYASQIKIPNENPGQANYLLEAQTVTAIYVDGANRKWFGTSNGGVFLMSADGTEQILNFTEDNSPLFSNSIMDITINGKTGEVFFVTDKGMISYKGTATEGDDYFRHVYTYPNPVQPGYTGLITITGLATNVNVKITDISGNIVFETTSEGGQAIWNGNNLSGKRVASGVYLVFSSNEDGTKTNVTKLLFLN